MTENDDNTETESNETMKYLILDHIDQNDITEIDVHKSIKYLILGCGSIGYNIIEELNDSDENILSVDINEKRIQDLRDHRRQAMCGDISDPILMEKVPFPEIAFILSSSHVANLAAVKNLKKTYPDTHIIARAMDLYSVDELVESGADIVLYPQKVVAKAAVNHMNNICATFNANDLFKLFEHWDGSLGIITHKNPDPDAISSAMALSFIANKASNGKLNVRILYEGNIGHQENRAFVNLLDIDMERITPDALSEYTHLALVDCPGPGINNDLPLNTKLDIIIDHHGSEGVSSESYEPEFSDIRPKIGATASILTQYFKELNIPIEKKIATALFYGIRSDTHEFLRGVSPQDMHNAAYLLPLCDRSLLDVIMSPSIDQETMSVLGKAITNREIKHGYLFSNVGYVRNRDAIPQAADMLLDLEGVSTTMIYGITDSGITLSARNKDVRLHIGDVMNEAFSSIPGASAGGHATMAALSIPLNAFSLASDKEELLNLIIDPIIAKFMKLVGIFEDEDTSGN